MQAYADDIVVYIKGEWVKKIEKAWKELWQKNGNKKMR